MNIEYTIVPSGTYINEENVPWRTDREYALVLIDEEDDRDIPDTLDGYPVLEAWREAGIRGLVECDKTAYMWFDEQPKMVLECTNWMRTQPKDTLLANTQVPSITIIPGKGEKAGNLEGHRLYHSSMEYWDLDVLVPQFVGDTSLVNTVESIKDMICNVDEVVQSSLLENFNIYPCKRGDSYIFIC